MDDFIILPHWTKRNVFVRPVRSKIRILKIPLNQSVGLNTTANKLIMAIVTKTFVFDA
ncbi:MAG: hypothetical protein H6939_13255 [Burkholderiales bacterium]|nr:hypothetical protein [Burkholderiales bacterium]